MFWYTFIKKQEIKSLFDKIESLEWQLKMEEMENKMHRDSKTRTIKL